MRLHLFEWMDQTWLPRRVRDAMRAYLSVAYRATPLPNLWATELAAVLRASGETRVVDLGSGAAGPVNLVVEALEAQGLLPQVTLTDLYPVERAGEAHRNVRYWPEPVDARAVPPGLPGTRTMFAAFHHCAPSDARAILRDAFTQKRAICIFEATSRTPIAIALAFLIPVLVLVLTPTIRPRSAFQLVFTYLIPVLPVLIFWDGLVSQLRTYSSSELLELTAGLDAPDYQWTSGNTSAPGLPMSVPYLIGRPIRPSSA